MELPPAFSPAEDSMEMLLFQSETLLMISLWKRKTPGWFIRAL
jgi:hypothetical protein